MLVILARFCRVPLLPTVWSHVLMASFLSGSPFDVWTYLAFSCVYLYGMGDNDWVDRFRDSLKAPNRPLPSGALSEAVAQRLLMLLLVVGILALFQIEIAGVRWGVATAILAATLYNHRFKDQVIIGALLLGIARASVVVGFAVSFWVPMIIGGVTFLITLWSTTEESHPERKVWTLRFLLLLPLVDMSLLAIFGNSSPLLFIFLVFPMVCWGMVRVQKGNEPF